MGASEDAVLGLKRAQRELQSRLEQQAAVAELGRLALQVGELQSLFEHVTRLAAQTYGVEYAKILELVPDSEVAGDESVLEGRLKWRSGYGWSDVGGDAAAPADESQGWYTLRHREPVICEDLSAETRFNPSPLHGQHRVTSGLSVIIEGRSRPFGVLEVYSSSVRRFSLDDIGFLQCIANVLSSAVRRDWHNEMLLERHRLISFEAEVFRAISQHTDSAGLLSACLQATVTHLGACLARAWLVDRDRDVLELIATAGSHTSQDSLHVRIPVGRYKVGRIAQTGRSELSNSFMTDPDTALPDWAARDQILGFAGHPLIVEGRVEGVLAMFSRQPIRPTIPTVLQSVADGIAQALARLRSVASLRESQSQLERVIDGSNDGFWEWHVPSGRIQYSARWASMLGFKLENIPPTLEGWTRLVHPDDLPRAQAGLSDYFAGRRPDFEMEVRMRTRSGEWKWILGRAKVTSWMAPGQPEWMTGMNLDIDERKRAEEALAQSKQRLDLLVRQSPLAVIEWTPAGAVSAWNPAAETIFGHTREEAMGLMWSDLVPPDPIPSHGELETVLARVGGGHSIRDNLTRDGAVIACEWFNTALVEDGQVIGAASICIDCTEARRTDQELRKLRLAFEQSPVGMVLTDREGSIEYVNPRFTEMSGYSASEALGQKPSLVKSGFHPREFYQELWSTILSGQVFRGEMCNRRKTGELYWERAVIAPVRNEQGQIHNFMAFQEDITGQKTMERQLAVSVDTFKGLFEAMQDGYVTADLAGSITRVNPAAARLFGYQDASELLGVPYAELFADEGELDRVMSRVHELGVVRDQGEFRRKDGSRCILEGTCWIQSGQDGQSPSLQVLFRDVTERVQAERERQARQEADQANRLKSQFLAHMSHEIRTPLHGILGMTHLALGTQLDERQRRYLENVQRGGRALLSIVNDILDFSKAEAGKLTLEQVEFALDDVIENLTSTLARKADEKGLEFLIRVAPEVPAYLMGDPMRLGQVLVNLVGNAIKFTDRGQVALTIALEPDSAGGTSLRFDIRDTGVGLTRGQLDNLFVPFAQADSSITRKYGGTGLGLAICQQLVHRMQGEIRVESAPGQGSVFSFTASFGTSGPSDAQKPPDLSELRVLVIEDNPDSLDILTAALRRLSVRVTEKATAEEALAAVQSAKKPYDLLFVGFHMPGRLNSLETIRRLRANDLRYTLIVLVAGHGDEGVAERAAEVGVNSVLFKPLRFLTCSIPS